MSALWYRHWIEMRGGFVVASGVMLLLAVSYPVFVATGAARTAGAGEVARAAAMGLDAERFAAWAPHVWICILASWIVGLFLWGTGIRPSSLQPNHPSVSYGLTLPVGRLRLLWSRFAAGLGAVALLFSGLLLVNGAALLVMGRPVPFSAMAASSALAALFVGVAIAVYGLVGLWDENQFGWVIPAAAVGAFVWGWPPMLAFIGSPRVPWSGIGILVLVAAAALSASVLLARRRDFC